MWGLGPFEQTNRARKSRDTVLLTLFRDGNPKQHSLETVLFIVTSAHCCRTTLFSPKYRKSNDHEKLKNNVFPTAKPCRMNFVEEIAQIIEKLHKSTELSSK